MNAKQERALVEFIVGKLWKKRVSCQLGSPHVGGKNRICDCTPRLDMNLAGEVMRRMKKRGCHYVALESAYGTWWATFGWDKGRKLEQAKHKNPELATLLAAKQALSQKGPK